MAFRTLSVLDLHPRAFRGCCSLNKREKTALAERSDGTQKKRELLMGERRDSISALPSLPPQEGPALERERMQLGPSLR